MQYFSCCSDKYTEIKMCDLEPFPKSSHNYGKHIANYLVNEDKYKIGKYLQAFNELNVYTIYFCQVLYAFYTGGV